MRRLVGFAGTLVVSVACVLAVAGCGSSKSSSSGASEQTAGTAESSSVQSVASEAESVAQPAAETAPASTSKYQVTINDAYLTEDYSGDPCIAINYTFTNVSDDDATSMMVAVSDTVYQNGVECQSAITSTVDTSSAMSKVKPGASIDVTRVYKLADTQSDVEVEAKELFSWDDTILAEKTFSLAELGA